MSEETRDSGSPPDADTKRGSPTQRFRQFAKDHPGTTLLVAAGATGLLAGELAIGALLGVGGALLVTKKSGADMRQDLRELVGSTKEWRRRISTRLHGNRGEAPPPPPAP